MFVAASEAASALDQARPILLEVVAKILGHLLMIVPTRGLRWRTSPLTLIEYSAAALMAMVAPAMRVNAVSKVDASLPTATDSRRSGTASAAAPKAREVPDSKPKADACCSLLKRESEVGTRPLMLAAPSAGTAVSVAVLGAGLAFALDSD
jgi:hypothetical protein